jgi:hypothetical protein
MQRLSVVGGMTAGVAVSMPLNVDGLVGSHVDNLGLGLEFDFGQLSLGGSGDGSGGNIVVETGLKSGNIAADISLVGGNLGPSAVALFGLSLGGLGRSRRLLVEGSGGSDRRRGSLAGLVHPVFRDTVDQSNQRAHAVVSVRVSVSLSTAHVELHVLSRLASLGLLIGGVDVCDIAATAGIPARHRRAPVGVGSLLSTNLGGASGKEEALLSGGAVGGQTSAVDVGDIEVVVISRADSIDEVLELGVTLFRAVLSLGELNGDACGTAAGFLVVLAIGIARLEGDHVVNGAAGVGALVLPNGPEVDLVRAAVDDLGMGLAEVARLAEGDCAPGGDSGSHDGGGGDGGDELHYCCLKKPNIVIGKDGEGFEIGRPKEWQLNT